MLYEQEQVNDTKRYISESMVFGIEMWDPLSHGSDRSKHLFCKESQEDMKESQFSKKAVSSNSVGSNRACVSQQ